DYILSTGCLTATTVTVEPVPATVVGPFFMCIGSAYTFTDLTPGGAWSSSNSAVGTIDATGVLTTFAPGTTTINYTAGFCVASTTVTVGPNPIAGIPAHLCADNETVFTVTDDPGGVFSSGFAIATNSLTVSGLATVNTTPIPFGGAAWLTYTLAGCSITAYFTVDAIPAITPSTPIELCTGTTITLGGVPTGGVWASSLPSVGTIDATTGVLGGISSGITEITYTAPVTGCYNPYGAATVDATPAPIGGPGTVCVGQSITLRDATGGGIWTSSAAGVASVGSGTGIVTG